MAFLIGGAQSSADVAYDIDNSIRFDDGAANGLARFGNNSRNNKTFTISFWMKRTELGLQQLVNCKVEDAGVSAFITTINSSDQLVLGGQFTSAGYETLLVTNNLLRDPSAWYHVVYRSDTTQSGATDRFKIYINGTEATYATDDRANVSQDDTWQYFYNASSYPYAISNDERDNVYGDYYMAEHHYCDGVSNAASAFGETDEDSGIWKPKKYTGSHGTYGHFLEFKESGAGSGTTAIGGHDYTTGSSSTIGADTSGNDHHFHVQGYSTVDQTTDTPTNNFATLNTLANISINDVAGKTFGATTYSEGNLKMVATTGGAGADAGNSVATFGSFMPFYFECRITSSANHNNDDMRIGVVDVDHASGNAQQWVSAYLFDGVLIATGESNNTGNTDTEDLDIIGVACDFTTNYTVTFYHNGTSQGVMAVGSAYRSLLPIPWIRQIETNTWEANFGNPPHSISSGNADANGYGNFEYAVPSGYYALCTKNLAEFG